MKFWAVRHGDALFPEGTESNLEFEKVPRDKPLQVEVSQPRNPAHHRLFWALCARIGPGIGKDRRLGGARLQGRNRTLLRL